MSRARLLLLVALLVAALAVAGVVVGLAGGDDAPEAAPTPTSGETTPTAPTVPLADVDTLTTAVRRGEFCDAVAPDAVEAALGGPARDTTTYADGQSAQLTGQVRDIAHEFGCGWTTRDAAARAWVFAPPVTPAGAKRLVTGARREDGCEPAPGAATFGRPSVALVCRTPRGLQASYRGLFGDAWLTCTVAGPLPQTEVVDRADRWCVAVLAALAP